jgi:molybdopterin-guanine dinucleotide biosynthesis protein A
MHKSTNCSSAASFVLCFVTVGHCGLHPADMLLAKHELLQYLCNPANFQNIVALDHRVHVHPLRTIYQQSCQYVTACFFHNLVLPRALTKAILQSNAVA